MNLTQAVLVAAATELNEVLGLDPAINLTLSRTELRNKVREAAELVEAGDTLDKDTQAVVEQLTKEKEEEKPTPTRTAKTNGKGDKDNKDDKDDKSPPAKTTGTKKKEAKKEEKKKPSFTKAHALHGALKSAGRTGVTRQELTTSLDELYVKKGGKSSPSGSKAMVDIHLPVLVVFGVVEKQDDRFRLKK
ncbi:hypothetical protein LCGC14_1798100 [marine sediment metagenome]|uniref:Uncharacterized protein n=1 Tax=marine sediment metagenome TaxID=412755 RepID=A0A0F9J579_9ZZZZ